MLHSPPNRLDTERAPPPHSRTSLNPYFPLGCMASTGARIYIYMCVCVRVRLLCTRDIWPHRRRPLFEGRCHARPGRERESTMLIPYDNALFPPASSSSFTFACPSRSIMPASYCAAISTASSTAYLHCRSPLASWPSWLSGVLPSTALLAPMWQMDPANQAPSASGPWEFCWWG